MTERSGSKRRDPRSDELTQARDHLQRLLSFRPRSIQEARSRLQQKRYSTPIIQQVIREAEERGWLDDTAFAKLWVQDRLVAKPKGKALLKSELRAKGIASELIEQTLNEAEINEEEIIQQLVEQQKTLYQGEDRTTRERKLHAFLRRRGFSPEAIRRALRERAA